MRVLKIVDYNSVRVFKEDHVLSRVEGITLDLLTASAQMGTKHYETCYGFEPQNKRHLRSVLEQNKWDIVHVHNGLFNILPTVFDVKEALGDEWRAKIVWDLHDMDSALRESVPFEEIKMYHKVDGVIHVSPEMWELAERLHGARPNVTVVYSACPAEFFLPSRALVEKIGGMVYHGQLDYPCQAHEETAMQETVSFRDYGDLFRRFVGAGCSVSLLSGANAQIMREYALVGCRPVGAFDYFQMFAEISKYYWGFVGFGHKGELLDRALPNKLFEYIACGVPPVVYNCDAAASLVNEFACGVVLEKPEHVKGLTPEIYDLCVSNLMRRRGELTAEAAVVNLIQLYSDLVPEPEPDLVPVVAEGPPAKMSWEQIRERLVS